MSTAGSAVNIVTNVKKKGVKRGSKRGHYERSTTTIRLRVMNAAENDEDWATVAKANGVKVSTAYNWVRKGTEEQKRRGGARPAHKKIHDEPIEYLIECLNDNPQLTLKEMAMKLLSRFNLQVTPQAIALHLNDRMISLKAVHTQPEAANNLKNKVERKKYVECITKVLERE